MNSHSFRTVLAGMLLIASYAGMRAMDIEDLNGKLIDAVNKKNKDLVAELLAKGADANAKYKNGWSALINAADLGHEDIVELLIEYDADVNAKERHMGWTPMDRATTNGHLKVCTLLIEYGAKINTKSDGSQTELMSAASHGHTKVCELLIAHNADVNAKGHLGWAPLTCATLNNHKEACELLITQGANINALDNGGNTALSQLLNRYSIRPEVCKLLIAKGTDLAIRNVEGSTPLMRAAGRSSSGDRKHGMLLTEILLDSITTLLPTEKDLIKSLLYANKKLQKTGKAYLPRDMRIFVAQHITCLLVEKLHERLIEAGLPEALVNSQYDIAMFSLLESYSTNNYLVSRAQQQMKLPKNAELETQSEEPEVITKRTKLKITEEESE